VNTTVVSNLSLFAEPETYASLAADFTIYEILVQKIRVNTSDKKVYTVTSNYINMWSTGLRYHSVLHSTVPCILLCLIVFYILKEVCFLSE
jgi:hypothetical protein